MSDEIFLRLAQFADDSFVEFTAALFATSSERQQRRTNQKDIDFLHLVKSSQNMSGHDWFLDLFG